MRRAPHLLLLLSLLALALTALPARPAGAEAASDQGFVWRIIYEFDGSLDGSLVIETGPMKNGVLESVEQTSTTPVPCDRVGNVALGGGVAAFKGGYLKCALDLGQVLLAEHGIEAPPVDSYMYMTMSTRLAASSSGLTPIVVHPDLVYQLEFGGGDSVTMRQGLATAAGPATAWATFPGMYGRLMRDYAYAYECAGELGPCSATHQAGASLAGGPVAGGAVSFRTGPTALLIGGDGATSFHGWIDSIVVDPGNTIK